MRLAALALTLFALVALLTPAHAHDADIATFVLRPVAAGAEGAAKGWVLDVHVAQAALVRAVGKPADTDWREAAVAYLRRHIRLTVDGAPVAFGGGGIRVGAHQTDARLLYALPDGATVDVTIDAFADDGHQSNVLKLRGATPRTIVLGEDTAYTARLTLRR